MIPSKVSPFALVQERVLRAHVDPRIGTWRVIVASVLVGKSSRSKILDVLDALLGRWSNPLLLGAAGVAEIEEVIRPCGLARRRALHLRDLSVAVADHDGSRNLARDVVDGHLVLPGVGEYCRSVLDVLILGGTRKPSDPALRAYWYWSRRDQSVSTWRDVLSIVGNGKGTHDDACPLEPRCECGVDDVMLVGAELDGEEIETVRATLPTEVEPVGTPGTVPWIVGRRGAVVGALAKVIRPRDKDDGPRQRRSQADAILQDWERAGIVSAFAYRYADPPEGDRGD